MKDENKKAKEIAALKREVLVWVNGVRKLLKKKPIKKLPKGHTGDSESCVIHNCLARSGNERVSVNYKSVLFYDKNGNRTDKITLPAYVTKLIRMFDRGMLPELQSK